MEVKVFNRKMSIEQTQKREKQIIGKTVKSKQSQ